MRPIVLVLLAIAAAAADPVGTWRFGLGTVDGQPAKVGTLVLTGQTVVSSDNAPLRLVCSEAPGIAIVLAAGSSGRFSLEAGAPDTGPLLILALDRGAVQMDVRDKGPYSGIRVRGASCDVKVTGTLFTVERVRKDADYVALVRGKVKVGMRRDVAAAAKTGDDVELLERHGVAVDGNGVGKPEDLINRPQIHMAAGTRSGTRDQGMGLSDQGTPDWGVDLAGELTGQLLEGSGLPGGNGPGDGPEPFVALAEDLVNTMGEFGQPPQSSSDTAVQVTGGSPATGGGLPPPPGHP